MLFLPSWVSASGLPVVLGAHCIHCEWSQRAAQHLAARDGKRRGLSAQLSLQCPRRIPAQQCPASPWAVGHPKNVSISVTAFNETLTKQSGEMLIANLLEANLKCATLRGKMWEWEACKLWTVSAVRYPEVSCLGGFSIFTSIAGPCFSGWLGWGFLWRASVSSSPMWLPLPPESSLLCCLQQCYKWEIWQPYANVCKSITHKQIHVINQLHQHSCQKMKWKICKTHGCRLTSPQLEVQKNV